MPIFNVSQLLSGKAVSDKLQNMSNNVIIILVFLLYISYRNIGGLYVKFWCKDIWRKYKKNIEMKKD